MEKNKNTQWFKDATYGIFVHYLYHVQNNPENPSSMGKHTSWDECVNEFDTDRFAKDAYEMGAAYVIFTMLQCKQYIIAPNEAFNKYSGYKTGEACSTRDLIADLIVSLGKYDIKLMPYFTADGPHHDEQARKGFDADSVSTSTAACPEFRKKWYEVAREFSERYGDKIHGWWVDGAHLVGYNDETLEEFASNLRAGNKKNIVAFNPGDAVVDVRYYTAADDYTAGERNKLYGQIPKERWLNGRQWHCLAPLGDVWGCTNCCYTSDELINQLKACMKNEGVITFDVGVYRDGSISKEQIDLMAEVKSAIR